MEEKINYNDEPIYYCKNCLSICIINGKFMDYCADCGSTNISQTSMEEYDEIRYKRFGKRLFNLK